VTINQWDYYTPSTSPSFATWWKQVPEDFQAKHPNIKLDFTFPDFPDIPTKYTAAVAGGTPPDLLHSSVIWSRDFWTAGTLLTLDAQVAQTPAVAMDQFIPWSDVEVGARKADYGDVACREPYTC